MTKNLKWIAVFIILGLLMSFGIFIQRSCKTDDRISILKGRFEAYQTQAEEKDKQKDAIISEKEKETAGLIEKNKEILKNSTANKEAIRAKNAEITKLKEERRGLTDKDAIIANQDQTIDKLELTLTWEREDKAKIQTWGMNWKTAYENEVVVSDEWKAKALREENLKNIAQEIVGKQDNKIKVLQLKGNLKSVLIGGFTLFAGYEFYRSIKK